MIENDPREKYLEYLPAPERPVDFDKQLKQIVGLSPSGEPNLRFSWGNDVTEILDGYSMHRYPDPEGKYVGLPFWVLEGWQNPDVYDRAEWEANEELFGPFPTTGIWDFIAIVQDENKRYMPLGSFALQMARDWRFWRSKTHQRVLDDLLLQRCKIRSLNEKRLAEKKAELQDEFVRTFTNALDGVDNRKRTLVSKIAGGVYQQTESGLLIPSTI